MSTRRPLMAQWPWRIICRAWRLEAAKPSRTSTLSKRDSSGRGRGRRAGSCAARRRTCPSGSARPSGTASCPRGGTACTGLRCRGPCLDPPPLAGPAPVVGLRGHVLDGGDLEPGGLQRADRRLAARAGALHEHLHLLEAVLHALARRGVGRDLRGERGGLARPLEAGAARRLPRDHVAFLVGQRHDRVVEARLDVRLAEGHVLPNAPAAAGTTWLRHLVLPYLLLAAAG